MTNDELHLDDSARRAIGAAYRLLITLAEEKAADGTDPVKEPQAPAASDSADAAPPQVKG